MSKDPWRAPDHRTEKDIKPGYRPEYDDLDAYLEGYPSRQHRQPRLVRLFIFLLGVAFLLYGLSVVFPNESIDDAYLIRALVIIVIFGGTAVFWSRSSLWRLVKIAGLWAAIVAGIAAFYLYKSDLNARFMSAVDPGRVSDSEDGLVIHRSDDGHFWMNAEINTVPIRLMIDTGASHIVLSPADAKRVGIDVGSLRFSGRADTANGSVPYARTEVRYLDMGSARFTNVQVTVNGADMQGSLLGMSILDEFSSVEIRGDRLILRL